MHWMFTHAEATGWKEHDQAIHQGWQQPSLKWDLGVEPSTMEVIGPETIREEFRRIYNEMYQLKRAPSVNPCDVEMAEGVHQEILNSVKECLLHRWEFTWLEEEPGWGSASTSRPDPQSEFQQRVCATYNHFRDLKEGSCKEALAVAWDTHRWELVAMALLEVKMERLSCSISHSCRSSGSCQWLGSCRWSGSCWWRRSKAVDRYSGNTLASSCHGEHISWTAQSPSPLHSRQWVTFEDNLSIGADNSHPLSWADEMV